MKPLIFTLSLLALTGCTITRQAQVSEASPISGIVRLTYNQPLFFTSRTDDHATSCLAPSMAGITYGFALIKGNGRGFTAGTENV
ncbi:hypothetical protein GUE23_000164 [Salmonella enterica]|nr:hypothetical protein [Salmonella enterica]